jgi:hypothetical protein
MNIEDMEQAERLRELARNRARTPVSTPRRLWNKSLIFMMSKGFWIVVIPLVGLVCLIVFVGIPLIALLGAKQ